MRAAQYIQTVLSLLALYSLAPVNAEDVSRYQLKPFYLSSSSVSSLKSCPCFHLTAFVLFPIGFLLILLLL